LRDHKDPTLSRQSTTDGGKVVSPTFHNIEVFQHNNHFCENPKNIKLNSVALVRERTIPTVRPPLVGEVSANFGG
jgi:hypothetical protein